jgi:Cys-tRNA(Pro)/Cys-tRNA(Cys) deacylase
MTAKTNAARILDQLGIAYELRTYTIGSDEHFTAAEVAAKVGLPPEQVYKTLVVRGDRHGVALAVVAGDSELDDKSLARAMGDRRVVPVALKEVTPLTGYVRGGVTALGLKRSYPVWIDETVQLFDVIAVSAGVRGTQIVLRPDDYVRATEGTLVPLGRPLRSG